MTNQASEDELENIFSELCAYMYGNDMGSMTEYRIPRFRLQKAKTATQALIRTEKLKLLAEVRERVVGEDEKLVIPDYPKTDDEGEPLYSKRAAKEGRKQVTARYHTRKELRNDQRTELAKLEAEL